MTTNFISPLSFVAVLGSGIRDPGSWMGKNQDPGSGINIPDPQHCIHFRYRFSHPGSGFRGKKGTGSQIWIGKHWIILTKCIF
jgi:hypothetical protein